jgi:hypothetical protein
MDESCLGRRHPKYCQFLCILKVAHPIHTQTLNRTFLYVTVSTLNPTVGIVVTLRVI